MTEPARANARHVQRALAYLAALHGDDIDRIERAKAQAAAWRACNLAHEAAWCEAERRWLSVQRLVPQLRESLAPEPRPLGRRQWLAQAGRGGAALALLATAGGLAWLWRPALRGERVLLTAHGEALRRTRLDDGSELSIAADTSLQVSLGYLSRQVVLAHGSVWFDVVSEPLRDFLVLTRLGTVRVVGTAFSVTDRGRGVLVKVGHGRVKVTGADGSTRLLQTGDRVEIQENGRLGAKSWVSGLAGQRWEPGWWAFTDTPLSEVLDEVNAYLPRAVEADTQAASLRLTGHFPSDEPQVLLQALPKVLPVRWCDNNGRLRLVSCGGQKNCEG